MVEGMCDGAMITMEKLPEVVTPRVSTGVTSLCAWFHPVLLPQLHPEHCW
jgi:hypothetical protein